ncbi:MAG: HAD-IC family P-type ATPase, partial [Chloroflexi bacterium]|nr:HAD-IC family P-type ATPase [Chloroflexota bacterium]
LQDAAFVGMVVLANVLVGTFQELRATRKLRQLVALTAPTATVVRGGEEAEVLATDVVEDDLVVLRSGDQVVADGPVVWAVAELDESILTGETSSVRRGPGDDLESGAFCVGGSCYYRAARVGDQSRAVRETRDARELTRTETPLQLRFKRILDGLIVATAILGLLILISFLITGREFDEAVKATIATATSVVPEGLMLGFTVAFAVGALRVSRLGAIVQDNTAVEALNYLDTICLDKTGTITANRLQVDDVRWAPGGSALVGWLGAFATSTSANNRTAQALDAAFALQSNGAESVAEEPFNSERRWSAARLRVDGEDRVFVLGAPERLLRSEGDDSDVRDELLAEYERAAERGLRGVVFAEAAAMPDAETDTLPRLRIVALITVADELRPEIANAFRMMKEFEIEPKIISGDNPATVAALIQQLGIRLDGGLISGTTLSRLKEDELADAVEENSVFGRIAPQQKEQIVAALQRNGHYVAMVGDGANDVRALRQADVGVAMESGASTAKGVASIVLRNDSFEALVQGTGIAQSVLGNASQLSKLFVTKSFYAFLIIFISNMMGLEFPFLPAPWIADRAVHAGRTGRVHHTDQAAARRRPRLSLVHYAFRDPGVAGARNLGGRRPLTHGGHPRASGRGRANPGLDHDRHRRAGLHGRSDRLPGRHPRQPDAPGAGHLLWRRIARRVHSHALHAAAAQLLRLLAALRRRVGDHRLRRHVRHGRQVGTVDLCRADHASPHRAEVRGTRLARPRDLAGV